MNLLEGYRIKFDDGTEDDMILNGVDEIDIILLD